MLNANPLLQSHLEAHLEVSPCPIASTKPRNSTPTPCALTRTGSSAASAALKGSPVQRCVLHSLLEVRTPDAQLPDVQLPDVQPVDGEIRRLQARLRVNCVSAINPDSWPDSWPDICPMPRILPRLLQHNQERASRRGREQFFNLLVYVPSRMRVHSLPA